MTETQTDAAQNEPGPSVSVVIPAFNESERIVYTLNAILDYAARTGRVYEIIVVDDGSTDGTARIAAGVGKRRATPPTRVVGALATCTAAPVIRVLPHELNRGKGYSVRRGFEAAGGQAILMCDADLSAPIRQLDRLLPMLGDGYDVVIGSRDLPGATLDPPQPYSRRLLARLFRFVRRRLMLGDIHDTQCGFKLFTHRAGKDIFSRVREDGWLFDCEALAIARRLGYQICETPITWRNHPASHVNPLREAIHAVPVLLRIRRRVRQCGRGTAKRQRCRQAER